MFDTLELQNLNKLVEGKVRDFASPKTFHCLKVQRLGGNGIKPPTQVGRTLVVPISALVGNFDVESCQLMDSTPPIARTSHFPRKDFVEFSELVQGLFQGLRVVYLLACIQGQIGVYAEVYPYAFTCSGQHFFRRTICYDIKPILTGNIPADLDILDVPFPIAMVVIQDISTDKDEFLFDGTPSLERQAHRAFSEFVSRLELRRTEFAAAFELRGTHTPPAPAFFQPIKEPLISDMDTDNHSVKRISRYPCPVVMRPFEQLGQVRLQPVSAGVFTVDAIVAFLQCQEVVMYIFKVIEHVAHAHVLRVITYLFFIRSAMLFLFFHGLSRITPLTPCIVGGTDTLPSGNAMHVGPT